MKIELLYFEGCPCSTEILGIAQSIVARARLDTAILTTTRDTGNRLDFSSSRTILVYAVPTAQRPLGKVKPISA